MVAAAPRPEFRPFTSASPSRAFDLIVSQMRERLATGELKPGDRLPGERELVEHFQVSRNTVREAVRMLEVSGLVEVRRGATGGIFVADGSPAFVAQNITDMMRLSQFSLADLLEIRLWLGSYTVQAAVDRATDADLEAMQRNVDEAAKLSADGDWDRRADVNHEFLDLLAAATHNPLLVVLQLAVTAAVREVVAVAGPIRDEWLLASRRTLLERIRDRDRDGATAQLREHLQLVNSRWVAALRERGSA